MTVTNDNLARAFLKERNSYGSNKGNTFHFDNDFLYSYSTLIAKYDLDKGIVFLTDSNMTPTTSKHRLALISEASKQGIKIMTIPMIRGQREFPTDDQVIARYETRMDTYAMGTELALADNRREFLINFESYKEFVELTGQKPKNFNKYVDISHKIEDTKYIKDLQKKRRQFLANQEQMFVDTINDSRYF